MLTGTVVVTPPALSWLTSPVARVGLRVTACVGAFLMLTQVWFPAPVPVLAVGVVFGALSALSAMGVVLVYRAARVVNFAQGEIGAAAGIVTVQFIAAGVPYLLAILMGLATGCLVGAFVEIAIVRRFRHAPRLVLMVATIGVAQLLAGVQLGLPVLFGGTVAPQDFPSAFDAELTWGPVVFRGDHVMAVLVVAVVGVALALFLQRSRYGLAVRAAAESGDRAAQLGIPVKRLGLVVWSAAAGMSALAVILRAPLVGLPIGEVLGPSLLVRSMAAAVIGGMEDLRLTFVAALGLGAVEQAVYWHTGRTTAADGVIFGVLAVAVVVRTMSYRRTRSDAGSSWELLAPIRPVPRELARLREVRVARFVLPLVGFGSLTVLPGFLSVSQTNLAAGGLIMAIVGVSLVILTGWSGQISLGQMALFGAGSITASWAAAHGAHLLIVVALAATVGALLAVLLGAGALRLPGPYLPVVTLAFALAASSLFLSSEFLGGLHVATRIERPVLFGFDLDDSGAFFRCVLLALGLTLMVATALRRSRVGRAMLAIRDNDRGAAAYGLRPETVRLWAFATSGSCAAFAGALFTYSQHGLAPTAWLPEESIRIFTMVVFGGLGSMLGVVLGALYITTVQYLVPGGATQFFASGVGLLAVLMFLRGGIGGAVFGLRDRWLRRLARQRGLRVPALVADDLHLTEDELLTARNRQ